MAFEIVEIDKDTTIRNEGAEGLDELLVVEPEASVLVGAPTVDVSVPDPSPTPSPQPPTASDFDPVEASTPPSTGDLLRTRIGSGTEVLNDTTFSDPTPTPPTEATPELYLRLWSSDSGYLMRSSRLEIRAVLTGFDEEDVGRFDDPADSFAYTTDSQSTAMVPLEEEDVFAELSGLYRDAPADPQGFEITAVNFGNDNSRIRFHSRNTRTIFRPHLLLATESKDERPETDAFSKRLDVRCSNRKPEYAVGRTHRFRIELEEAFRQRDFLGERTPDIDDHIVYPDPVRFNVKDVEHGHSLFPDVSHSSLGPVVEYGADVGYYIDLDLKGFFCAGRRYEVSFELGDEQSVENAFRFRTT